MDVTGEEGGTGSARLDPSVRRLLQSAGAVAGLAGLAGCSTQNGESTTSEPEDPRESTTTTRTSETSTTTETTASAQTTQATTTTAAETTTTTPCPDPGPIEREIDALETEIADVQTRIDEREQEVTRLRALRGQLPGGWDEEMLASARSTAESIRDSVVVLDSDSGGGTGCFIDESHIVTNAHVAKPQNETTVYTLDEREMTGSIVGRVENWQPDVAVLRVDGTGTPLDIGSSEDLEPGTPIVQVGHPLGGGYWVPSLGRYLKREAAFGGTGDYDNLYSTIVGRQGVSGSPVVTLDGDVVGLTWGAVSHDNGRGVDQAPEVASARVVDYPIAPQVWAQHAPVETVVDHYQEWTA